VKMRLLSWRHGFASISDGDEDLATSTFVNEA
jgi:hypothetical protein